LVRHPSVFFVFAFSGVFFAFSDVFFAALFGNAFFSYVF